LVARLGADDLAIALLSANNRVVSTGVVAAIHAGIETREFEQMIAMRRSLLAA
jgi:hypothetical protein